MSLKVGDPAPLFDTHFSDGSHCESAMFLGRRLLLYFYPRDNTPGCTAEACSLRDAWKDIVAENLAVIGVSPDSDASHGRFAEKFNLPFPLIADTEHLLAEAYGVWKEKKRFGRSYFGILRTSFLIDANGKIEYIFDKVKTVQHAEQVLAYLHNNTNPKG